MLVCKLFEREGLLVFLLVGLFGEEGKGELANALVLRAVQLVEGLLGVILAVVLHCDFLVFVFLEQN